MGEVAYMDEGELEAIVRGYSGSGEAFSGESSGGYSPSFCLPTESFYEPEMETTGLDELGELYKPFYPFSTQTILTSSVSVPEDSRSFRDDKKQRTHVCLLSNGSRVDHIRIPESKSKKSKKNQQKRVVEQVKEENLLSDAWAWRKYGQKPIKGSPYPRSYYRCSSSKGCLARKQVERNPENPEKFTITYTNEHNHELPTRRNSLAGSTRAKSSQPKPSVTKKSGKQVVSSPTSNPMITSTDESSVAVQAMGVAEMCTYHSTGELEGTSNNLPSDLLSGTGKFPSFTGDFDELLNSQEFLNGYLWNY
uniref:WRKY64 transcription factor n=1 Tax=Isatis tinctoria TaxID=161756 RepID=A0A6G8R7L5_ISATI|nr:WRKY64 transcription factor [Isatis tinctoria]